MGNKRQKKNTTLVDIIALYGVKALINVVRSVTVIAHASQIWLLISVVALAQTNYLPSAISSSQFALYYNYPTNNYNNNQTITATSSSSVVAIASTNEDTTTTSSTTTASSFALFPSVEWLVWLVKTHPIAFALSELYLFLEVAFYYFYWASWRKLQRARLTMSSPIAVLSSKERLELAKRCFDSIPTDEIQKVFRKWFFGAEFDDVLKKGNLERWLAWAFFNKEVEEFTQEELDDLHTIIKQFELKSGKRVVDAPADPKVSSLRLNLDPLKVASRPMIFYIVIYAMHYMTCAALYLMGFRRHHAGQLIYWVRQIRPETRLLHSCPSPLVFIHGIGCGLGPYLGLVYSLVNEIAMRDVFLIELPHISMRIVGHVPEMDDVLKSFDEIMLLHNIDKASFVGHSFGTAVVAWMVKHRANCLRDVVYIDPICFLLCMPKVAYKVVYKQPETAMEWLRYYFVTKELYIANSLTKRFVWFHNALWADQLTRGRTTVVLSSRDDIVPSERVQQYLINSIAQTQKKVDVIWLPETVHAGFLFNDTLKRKVVSAIDTCE